MSQASPSQDSTHLQTSKNNKADTSNNVIFPSLSIALSKNETRHQSNYAKDDCASLTDTSLTSDDFSDLELRNSAPSSPVEHPPPSYGFKHLKHRQNAVLTIQKFWMDTKRNVQSRELASYKLGIERRMYTSSTVRVQTAWRKTVAMRSYKKCIAAVIAVQTVSRGVSAKSVLRKLRVEREELHKVASTRIQTVYRGYSVRSKYVRNRASTRIQAIYRGYSARSKYQREMASIRIQAAFRGYSARSKYQRETASIRIQAAFRGYSVRSKYIQNQASTRIQIAFRAYVARYKNLRETASTQIQSAFRGHMARSRYAEIQASTRIQSFYRGYVTRCEHDLYQIISDIILCQSIVRRMLAIKTLRTLQGLDYLLQGIAAKKIQAAYRTHKEGSTLTKRLLMQRRTFEEYENEEEDILGLAMVGRNLVEEDDAENNLTYVVDTDDEAAFEAKCCEHSRCGLADEVHQLLLESGKWFYEKLGDPDVDTAENLITVMELSEEASACFCWKPALSSGAGKTTGPVNAVSRKTKRMGRSSVVVIQSKWRAYVGAKKFIEMKKRRTRLV